MRKGCCVTFPHLGQMWWRIDVFDSAAVAFARWPISVRIKTPEQIAEDRLHAIYEMEDLILGWGRGVDKKIR